ncbi:MAG TPA: hypothetical protein PLP88_03540 [Bacteroidales bacterium]|nr:hypothetical protein [Bacteroidales bacterium]
MKRIVLTAMMRFSFFTKSPLVRDSVPEGRRCSGDHGKTAAMPAIKA